MRKIIFIILFHLSGISFAQMYHPFTDSTSFWHSVGFDHGSFQEYSFLFGMHGDTVIANNQYSKVYRTPDTLFSSNLEYVCALRENDNRQVLIKLPEDPEFVLYDFNLNVGDTISYPTGYIVNNNSWGYSGWNSYRIVQSIDSILLNTGEYRKRWNLFYPFIYGSVDHWVEGIGSIGKFGLLYPLVSDIYTNFYNYFFGCYVEANEIVFFDSTFCYSCLGQSIWASSKPPKGTSRPSVLYNYSDRSISIRLAYPPNNCYVTITNQLGQAVISYKAMGTENIKISVAMLPKGIYIYSIIDRKSRKDTGKILIL